ncbi:hypothetical protein FEP90_04904 [Burkholderia multivorans]|nr:hypothetical protein [Burkholderia multivorans]
MSTLPFKFEVSRFSVARSCFWLPLSVIVMLPSLIALFVAALLLPLSFTYSGNAPPVFFPFVLVGPCVA